MNIVDMINLPQNKPNSVSSKLAVQYEMRNIEKKVDDIIANLLDWLIRENSIIDKGVGYSLEAKYYFSEEDKTKLRNKLKEIALSIPEKIKSEISEVFNENDEDDENDKDEKKEDNKESEKPDNDSIEVKVTPPTQFNPNSIFGY